MELKLQISMLKRVLIKGRPEPTATLILKKSFEEVSCKLADSPFYCSLLVKCSMYGLYLVENYITERCVLSFNS